MKSISIALTLVAASAFATPLSQQAPLEFEPLHSTMLKQPKTVSRPFMARNFLAEIDARPLAIIHVDSVRDMVNRAPLNINSRPLRVYTVTVLDSSAVASTTTLTLVENYHQWAQPAPLVKSHNYLIYAQLFQNPPGSNHADVPDQSLYLEMAVPTGASKLPTGRKRGGETIVAALVDALEGSHGQDSLEIGATIGSRIPGTENSQSGSSRLVPLTGEAARIARLAEGDYDIYVKTAALKILADAKVAGASDRFFNSLAELAMSAPEGPNFERYTRWYGVPADMSFTYDWMTPGVKFDVASVSHAAVHAKNLGLQEELLHTIGKKWIPESEAKLLVSQLQAKAPADVTSREWQVHLLSICAALDNNDGADPRSDYPPSAFDALANSYSLRHAIEYWINKVRLPSP